MRAIDSTDNRDSLVPAAEVLTNAWLLDFPKQGC